MDNNDCLSVAFAESLLDNFATTNLTLIYINFNLTLDSFLVE